MELVSLSKALLTVINCSPANSCHSRGNLIENEESIMTGDASKDELTLNSSGAKLSSAEILSLQALNMAKVASVKKQQFHLIQERILLKTEIKSFLIIIIDFKILKKKNLSSFFKEKFCKL
jgi:hypothetical protein